MILQQLTYVNKEPPDTVLLLQLSIQTQQITQSIYLYILKREIETFQLSLLYCSTTGHGGLPLCIHKAHLAIKHRETIINQTNVTYVQIPMNLSYLT